MRYKQLDDDSLGSWLTDSDYEAYGRDIYVDRETGEWIVVYEYDEFADADGASTEEENSEDRTMVASASERFIELPVPDHRDSHDFFALWLQERGWNDGEGYPSIGRWLKEFGSQEDRYEFNEYRRGCAIANVHECLAEHGLASCQGKIVSLQAATESLGGS